MTSDQERPVLPLTGHLVIVSRSGKRRRLVTIALVAFLIAELGMLAALDERVMHHLATEE